MKRRAAAIFGLFALSSVGGALGYVFLGPVWNSDRVVMHLQLGDSGGALMDGSRSWNSAAESALAIWNSYIRRTQFAVVRDSTAPIRHGNGVNNVFFGDNVYGTSFSGAVAITTEWTSRGVRTEGDVIFNTQYAWNSYRGALRRAAGGGTLYDIRRVAIHEFGHVLGLDHPDEAGQIVAAIMNSSVSNLDTVQPDDIAGAQALYGARGGGGPIGAFTKPRKATVSTSRSRFVFRGTAKPRVEAVYLKNHRIPRRFFLAAGAQRWQANLRLKPGGNRVVLFVDDGVRVRKVARVTVTRRR